MGVKNLVKFLREQQYTPQIVHFNEMKNKTYAVDILPYLYTFKKENMLVAYTFLMCELFKKYQIHPIFVFDGGIPAEKKELVERKHYEKVESLQKLYILEEELKQTKKYDEFKTIQNQVFKEKQSCVFLSKGDTNKVKILLSQYGFLYISDLPYEADAICAKLEHLKLVDGCMSEDNDLFLYGCQNVLKHINLENKTLSLYNINDMCSVLNMSTTSFKEMCVASGTDYCNVHIPIEKVFELYNNYKSENSGGDFYYWLQQYNHITDVETYISNDLMFTTNHVVVNLGEISRKKKEFTNICIKKILSEDGFVFMQ